MSWFDVGDTSFGGMNSYGARIGGGSGMGCGCLAMFLVVLWLMLGAFFVLGYFAVKDATIVAGGM